ncbi:polysaccharide pyruvyl transferase family protein [Bordetella muralis]|uniref:polysaccharide pyruvyl transferase family protein n=1 Tax=Bordetella muralis TaxID=1649130 RepID=UPI0039F06147
MFKEISGKLSSFLQRTGLDQHVVRKWVYRKVSYVVDFIYRDVKFGFDVSPLANGQFLLELIERRHDADIVLVDAANRKQLLSRSASANEVVKLIGERAAQLVADIDAYHSRSHPGALSVNVRVNRPIVSAKSLRVGILTLPLNSNIGGNLQAYAMMESLRRLGHSPVFINSKRLPSDATGKSSLGSPDLSRPLLTKSVGLGRAQPNTKFVDKYLVPITVPFNSSELLARDVERLGLDAIVAGSDQIWRPRYARAHLGSFFFNFLSPESKIKRISYAASFGASTWEFSDEQTRDASLLVKHFDAVGVREDRAVELCAKHLGVEAQLVLDPTLLLDRDAYAPIISEAPQRSNAGQIVAYVLDVTPGKVAVVQELARELDLQAFATTGQSFPGGEETENEGADKSVQHWLASLNEAAFIVTDSFHGVAFSILFNKPFIAYGNPSRGMSRFTSLLKIAGLESRLVTKSSDVDVSQMMQPIDWDSVNERLAKWRASSYEFLANALAGKGKARVVSPAVALPKTNEILKVRSEFVHNTSAWSVNKLRQGVELSVAEGAAAKLRNLVWCELPVRLQAGSSYRLSIKWSVSSTGSVVKPCIRNPKTGKIHTLAAIRMKAKMAEMHTDTIDFSPPGDGFSQFVLGAASFPGPSGGAKIEAMTLQQLAVSVAEPNESLSPRSEYADKARMLALRDSNRYSAAYAHGDPLGRARGRLMYSAHSIEKGLSHANFRAGFGKTAIERLANGTRQWLAMNNSIDDPFFKSAISVMYSYFERHRQINFDVSHFHQQFSPAVQKMIAEADNIYGGVAPAAANREPIINAGEDRTFIDVVYSRRSVREFTDAKVEIADIRRAVQIASQAPSVCNRQGPRVHHFSDPEQIRALVDLQKGFGGYSKPPILLLVTCDLTAFFLAKERNQAFVDGGLFLMGLLLGLEQVGLGACPLNTTMDADREDAIRKVSRISEDEVLISFVAVGHYDSQVLVPRSVRYSVEHLLCMHKSTSSEKVVS